MKPYLKSLSYLLLCMSLLASTACCSDDLPLPGNATPPVVPLIHRVSGRVTDFKGQAVNRATVTLTGEVTISMTTDGNGTFTFDLVKPGTYDLKAEASGKLPKAGRVTVGNGETSYMCLWNVVLDEDRTQTVTVKESEATSASVFWGASAGNEAAEVKMDVVMHPSAVSVGKAIQFVPFYPSETMSEGMENEPGLLMGCGVKCSDLTETLIIPLYLTFALDAEFAGLVAVKKYVNGVWQAASYKVVGTKVIVTADSFGVYGLFLDFSVSLAMGKTELLFSKNEWDNLSGANALEVTNAMFSYKVGTEIEPPASGRVSACLTELLARRYGTNAVNVTGVYPINVTLPVGTLLAVSGEQVVKTYTAQIGGRMASVKQYGDVSILVKTRNRQEN